MKNIEGNVHNHNQEQPNANIPGMFQAIERDYDSMLGPYEVIVYNDLPNLGTFEAIGREEALETFGAIQASEYEESVEASQIRPPIATPVPPIGTLPRPPATPVPPIAPLPRPPATPVPPIAPLPRPPVITPSPPATQLCPANQTRATVPAGWDVGNMIFRFGVSYDAIRLANPRLNIDNLRAGQVLCIPPSGTRGICTRVNGFSYIIVQGDSVDNLAMRNRITATQLFRANPNLAPQDFIVGRVICIPR